MFLQPLKKLLSYKNHISCIFKAEPLAAAGSIHKSVSAGGFCIRGKYNLVRFALCLSSHKVPKEQSRVYCVCSRIYEGDTRALVSWDSLQGFVCQVSLYVI